MTFLVTSVIVFSVFIVTFFIFWQYDSISTYRNTFDQRSDLMIFFVSNIANTFHLLCVQDEVKLIHTCDANFFSIFNNWANTSGRTQTKSLSKFITRLTFITQSSRSHKVWSQTSSACVWTGTLFAKATDILARFALWYPCDQKLSNKVTCITDSTPENIWWRNDAIGTIEDFITVMANIINHSGLSVAFETKRWCLTGLTPWHEKLIAQFAQWPVQTVKVVAVRTD